MRVRRRRSAPTGSSSQTTAGASSMACCPRRARCRRSPMWWGKAGVGFCLGGMGNNCDPAISWKDLDFSRAEGDGPLIIKGVLDPEDAREAAAIGADGIIVSNHGGRQLDGVLSSARALPPIADVVGDRLTVLADGGIRSGLDVVRMLALGAKGVLLGRIWAYALAARDRKSTRLNSSH